MFGKDEDKQPTVERDYYKGLPPSEPARLPIHAGVPCTLTLDAASAGKPFWGTSGMENENKGRSREKIGPVLSISTDREAIFRQICPQCARGAQYDVVLDVFNASISSFRFSTT